VDDPGPDDDADPARGQALRQSLADVNDGLIAAAGMVDGGTARLVAEELSTHDALTAQLDAEYRLDPAGEDLSGWRAAARAGLAFTVGAAIPVLVGTLAPPPVRIALTFGTVVVALVVSATLNARSGRSSTGRAVARTVSIGVLAMLVSIALGSLLDLSEAEVEL